MLLEYFCSGWHDFLIQPIKYAVLRFKPGSEDWEALCYAVPFTSALISWSVRAILSLKGVFKWLYTILQLHAQHMMQMSSGQKAQRQIPLICQGPVENLLLICILQMASNLLSLSCENKYILKYSLEPPSCKLMSRSFLSFCSGFQDIALQQVLSESSYLKNIGKNTITSHLIWSLALQLDDSNCVTS